MLPAFLFESLRASSEAIGFWAAVLTTIAFAPQVVAAWRTGGHGLSWSMLMLFGAGVGLWFLYGLLEMSRPVVLANGLTGLQVLALLALKIWKPERGRARASSEDDLPR